MTTDMERLAEVWLKMQDKMDAITAQANKEIADIKVQQDKVSTALLSAMNTLKQTKSMTKAGEIEKKAQMKVSAADWAAVYRFVVANDAFDLLHKRLSSTFVEKYAETHKDAEGNSTLPPGVNVFTEFKVVVKKPKTKGLPKDEG